MAGHRSSSTAGDSAAEAALEYTRLWYPVVLLAAFICSAAAHSILSSRKTEDIVVSTVKGPGGKPLPVTKKRSGRSDTEHETFGLLARRVFQYMTAAVTLTFIGNGTNITIHALTTEKDWWCGDDQTVYVLGSAFLYLYFLINLVDGNQSPTVVHFIVWCLASVAEFIILVTSVLLAPSPHRRGDSKYRSTASHTKATSEAPAWEIVDVILIAIRLGLLLGHVLLYAGLTAKRKRKHQVKLEHGYRRVETDERAPLLNGHGHGHETTYRTQGTRSRARSHASSNGNAVSATNGAADTGGYQYVDEQAAFYRPDKLPKKTWWEYFRAYSIFFPYLWPGRKRKLQMIVLVCFILLIFQRAVNILVPFQLGVVTDGLAGDAEQGIAPRLPWVDLSLLIVYKLLQGPSGVLGSVRALIWIPVSQYSYRALTSAAFEHVHSLSLDFHLGKRTGEVLSALNKGASINQFLEQVTFQVFPMLIDLFVAIAYFYVSFGANYAVLVSIITFYYLYVTIRMAATRADQRREMVNADREEEAVKNDSITSYETVKYFNAEEYEFSRYRTAIKNFQTAEAKVTYGMNYMNICQNIVFMVGLLAAMMLAAYEVSKRYRKVGDFVTIVTYLNQLQGPLNFFGTFYRTVQQALISGERLLELFKMQPTVVDRPGVKPLPTCDGHIKWDDVSFSYDTRRKALQNLTFECKPGTTTAFVGESGGGKSTLFRLMFRYYNCSQGRIEVDGHDVKSLTIDSVRRYIGVVPQDTILFNETLMYNLKYARQGATDEEVYEACRAASIHDRIMSFPDGYDTKVGERGLRLSGGEKQRVAIARTILKNPKVIMLDEATSALDSHTEQEIQSKLGNFGEGRTLMIIAHRLSTITHANQIIVLHAGAMVEKGTHEQLLALGGRYASMWEKQVRAERAAEEARMANRRANRLLRQANIGGDEHHDEPSDGDNSLASSTILPSGPATPGSGTHSHHGDTGSGSEEESFHTVATNNPNLSKK